MNWEFTTDPFSLFVLTSSFIQIKKVPIQRRDVEGDAVEGGHFNVTKCWNKK